MKFLSQNFSMKETKGTRKMKIDTSNYENTHGRKPRGEGLKTQSLTQLEFEPDDFEKAARIARKMGYTQTAYTSSSALWGLFCLPDRPKQARGCVIKTAELGLLFVQDADDLGLD